MSERKGRFYDIPAPERDRQIVALTNRGWTNVRIGRQVGMTESGVRSALARISEGGFGQGQGPR
jgi:DNA-binding NarL/FixJ family response regulator